MAVVITPIMKDKLSDNDIEHIKELSGLPKGWRFGEGESLDPKSVEMFSSFLEATPELDFPISEPSIFLTPDGFMAIEWNLGKVEYWLTFESDAIRYLISGYGEECEGYCDTEEKIHSIFSFIRALTCYSTQRSYNEIQKETCNN